MDETLRLHSQGSFSSTGRVTGKIFRYNKATIRDALRRSGGGSSDRSSRAEVDSLTAPEAESSHGVNVLKVERLNGESGANGGQKPVGTAAGSNNSKSTAVQLQRSVGCVDEGVWH